MNPMVQALRWNVHTYKVKAGYRQMGITLKLGTYCTVVPMEW